MVPPTRALFGHTARCLDAPAARAVAAVNFGCLSDAPIDMSTPTLAAILSEVALFLYFTDGGTRSGDDWD